MTLTHAGLRRYTKLPMGLVESPSVCQKLVAQTLAGIPGVISYIDDILVFGPTVEAHDRALNTALERLAAKNFRLQLPKCEFCVPEIPFLGHRISADGIRPDPEKTKAVSDAPQPKTKRQVQSFLGMVNYYGDFLPDLAT